MLKYQLTLAKYKLRSYELQFALNELKGQFPDIQTSVVSDEKIEFEVENLLDIEKIKGLTYFSLVSFQNAQVPQTYIVPNQVIFEKTNHSEVQPLFKDMANTKREIRYLTHAFHEYKGRYYPQLAKSLLNYAGVQKGDTLFDPFCGSGTGLVESFLQGLNAFGTDINPIAYLIAKSKIRSFFIEIQELEDLRHRYDAFLKQVDLNTPVSYQDKVDFEYLTHWFPMENLKKVLFLMEQIEQEVNPDVNLLLKVTLSNILKEYSYQDPTQLRIRRRKDEPKTNLLECFLFNLEKNIKILKNFNSLNIDKQSIKIENYLCDIKDLQNGTPIQDHSIDVVVTSPPYLTALPYIDTDRISLFALGLAKDKSEFRQLERIMIGTREITPKERQAIETEMIASFETHLLPTPVSKMIEKIYTLNEQSEVGFRRKNMAALAFKYFVDMQLAMKQVFRVLKKGKYAFFIVGNNRTTAGEELIDIPTDDFIVLIGQQVGFTFEQKMSLDVQKSYMIYSKNAINTESVLVFKKQA